ncbi:MAG: hypothetical protein NC432_00555 [Roseburia sp.]|nr:hypothetical protein [Roseburia sp.]MCM1098323.1 hypothetical protein [Ruminococcus flavefaciens]
MGEIGGALRQWIAKKGWEKYFRRENLILLILAGILLFVIALPTEDGERRKEQSGSAEGASGQGGVLSEEASGLFDSASENRQAGEAQTGSGEGSLGLWSEGYAAQLEARLTESLSEMEEVGKVNVMITLKTTEERVVERETSVAGTTTEETDAQGGSRRVESRDREERVVYSTTDGDNQPYVIKAYVPQIEGVLVVAQGAGTGTVNRTVTEIVQALFGIEAHKIKVVKMKD